MSSSAEYIAAKDIYKATRIIGNIDNDLAYVDRASNYVKIIQSCEQILLTVAEELYQIAAAEAEEKNNERD